MKNKLIEKFAEDFFNIFYKGYQNNKIKNSISDLSVQESYDVQDLIAKKKIEKGEKAIGYKVGCTSSAIQAQFGLNEPIFGRLFWPHVFDGGKELDWRSYTNCAIEPEMVLKIGKDLRGENLSKEVLLDAIEYVSPGIEIHNFKFWCVPPTIQELICSNGLHSGIVIGDNKNSPKNLSFESEWFKVYEDDKIITKEKASEIMGGPLYSLRWLTAKLTKRNEILRAGSFVIPGSPVELINIFKDTRVTIHIERVGKVSAYFKSSPENIKLT